MSSKTNDASTDAPRRLRMKPAAATFAIRGCHDADVAGQAAFRFLPPSQPRWRGGSLCLACCCTACSRRTVLRELSVVGLRPWCGRLPGVQVHEPPEMSFFPPALEIADLTAPPNA
ncbi:MAG: hypothetical protein ACLRWP_15150 [Bilophila wadsworthia]